MFATVIILAIIIFMAIFGMMIAAVLILVRLPGKAIDGLKKLIKKHLDGEEE